MITMCAVQLDFVCDVCGLPIEDGEGSLYVRDVELQAYRRAGKSWPQVNGQALLIIPDDVPWLIHHHACEPRESDGYHIAVEQVRTWRQLVSWTAHLMEKNWLPHTNWAAVIGGAAEGRERRIVEHVRNDAA